MGAVDIALERKKHFEKIKTALADGRPFNSSKTDFEWLWPDGKGGVDWESAKQAFNAENLQWEWIPEEVFSPKR